MLEKKGYILLGVLIGLLIALPINTGTTPRSAFGGSDTQDSPTDRISADQIQVYSDRVIIDKENLVWASIKDTHSMEPVLNKDSHSLESIPASETEIQVGDIISYKFDDMVIIHRVIETGHDLEGWYAITQGDNLDNPDPDKVRFEQVKGIVVGILY